MKKKISIVLSIILMLSALLHINVSAASYPKISANSYIEFKAQENINVYKDTSCTTRGTSKPSKKYNASISKDDDCYIYEITSDYIQVNYPTSSGRRTGYIKRSALFEKASPAEYISSAQSSVTVYKAKGNSSIARGDQVWLVDSIREYDGYQAVIYDAKSGKRAYKMGYVTLSDLDKLTHGVTPVTLCSPVPEGCYFNKKTTDCGGSGWYGYHDINRNVSTSTPVYAIADGTIKCLQKYTTINGKKYLVSYGNLIEFTSSDHVYTAKYAHLSKFNDVAQKISSKNTKKLSASKCKRVYTYTLEKKEVKQGEIIGYIGTTGNSSGVHLHFELYENGSRIDPTSVFDGLTE